VSTANALLDRGYGKPAVKEEVEHLALLPVAIQITGSGGKDDPAGPDTP
jgi:hypothetical protein